MVEQEAFSWFKVSHRTLDTVFSFGLNAAAQMLACRTWYCDSCHHKSWGRKSVATIEGDADNPVQVQVSWADSIVKALKDEDS